jgi:MFS family permease
MALSLFGAFSLVPVLVQRSPSSGGLGLDAAAAGLLMLPCAALTFVTAPTVGLVIRRWGAKPPLFVSCVTVALGLVVLGVAHIGVAKLAVLSGLLGLGFGALSASAPNLIVASVSVEETGAQTGVTQMVQNLGTSLGSQLSAVLMVALAAQGARVGSQVSLGVCAGAMLCAALAALFIDVRIASGAP